MRLQRAEWATALLITLFAVGLHGLRLVHAGPLWRDEAAAFHLATSLTPAEVVATATTESFPPSFFFLVRSWAAVLGGSDASLRFFGLLVGLGLLALFWWSVRTAAGTAPLLALSLVAVNPSVLLFGDSLRGYGLGTVAIVATFGAFARLAARPDRGAIALAAATALLSVQILFFNAALLLALGLAAIGVGILRRRPRVILAVVAIGAAAALSLLLWIESVLATRSWSGLLEVPLGSQEILGEMARTASAPVGALRWVWLLLAALALVPLRKNGEDGQERKDARLFAQLALPGLLLAQWGFMEALDYAPRPWYFLAFLAVAAVALDVRLSGSHLGRASRLGAAVLAVLALALPVTALARVRMTNVDLVEARIAAEAAPGDLVIVAPWYMGISYLRYVRGSTPWMTLPDLPDHRIHRFDLLKVRLTEPDPLSDVLGAVERTLRSDHRVWVAGNIEIPPPGAALSALDEQNWSQRFGAFLRDHATQGGRVPVPWNGPVNGYERLELLVFSGWRQTTPIP
ncbi:MAG TPA: hypothetical protein VF179_20655 [Thermoanaerobaculia bacterium]|nr:hypothetical protein [Thermoanaerobaculia bacterium]